MGSRKKLIISILVILLVLSGAVFLGFHPLALPQVKGVDAPLTEFSAERAVKHIEATAIIAHPTGSRPNQDVRDYIVNQLQDMGFTFSIQKKNVSELPLSENARNYYRNQFGNLNKEIENIDTLLKGSGDSQNAIMLVAHYDSVRGGPGAADDGYGVATLLETARALKASNVLKNDVIFLFTDGEEIGLVGAKTLAQYNRQFVKNVKAVINLEARGNKGPLIMFRTGENSRWLVNAYKKMATYPVAFSFSNELFKRMPNDTDFSVFKAMGLEGMDFAVVEGADAYHTPNDNIKNLSKKSLQHYGESVLPLVRYLGDLENINELMESGKNGAVYFPVLRKVLAAYPDYLAIPFCVITLILLLVVLVMEWRKKVVSIKDITIGIMGILWFSIITTMVATIIVFLINMIFKPKRYGLTIMFQHSNLFMVLILFVTLILAAFMYRLLSGKITSQNMQAGALIIWSVLMITTSFFMVGASYLFTWPVLFVAISRFLNLWSDRPRKGSPYLPWIGFILSAVPGIVLFAPTLYLIYIAMTIGLAPAVVLLFTLMLGILMPAVHERVKPYWEVGEDENVQSSVAG